MKPYPLRLLACWLLVLCIAQVGHAGQVLELRKTQGFSHGLNAFFQVYRDPGGRRSFSELKDQDFEASASPPIESFGYSKGAIFKRLIVTNVDSEVREWLLVFSSPVLDRIDLRLSEITATGLELRLDRSLGDEFPYSERSLAIFQPNAVLQLEPGRSYQLDLRIQGTSALRTTATLQTRAEAQRRDAQNQYYNGLYYGLVLALVAFNLVLWLSLRERLVFWFIAHAVTAGFQGMVLSGRAFAELWPNSPQVNPGAHAACLLLGSFCALSFANVALSLRERSPLAEKGLRWLANIALGMVVLSVAIPWHYWVVSANTLLTLAVASIAIVSGMRALRGDRIGLAFFAAWSLFLLTAFLAPLMAFGLHATGSMSRNLIQVGSGLELIFMSFFVVNRIRQLREADQEQLRLAASELEQRVQARTEELSAAVQRLDQANRSLRDMSQLDGLTGLVDRRRLDQLLEETWQRHLRDRFPLVVMMIDLDHFKAVNDRYGHLVGDDCLRSLAARLRVAFSEPQEVTARYGGEEFTVILPRCSLEQAHVRAQSFRIEIEQMAVTTQRGPINITVSIGLVSVEAERTSGMDELLERADRALYEAKRQGRNCVVVG